MVRRQVPPEFQQIMPLTEVVKVLIITTVSIWFVGNVVVEQYLLSEPRITMFFALTPLSLVRDFYIWQPVTYLFVHSPNPMHIIFNLLLLWWLGSELERLWGGRFFTLFYFVSGVGAGLLYCLGAFIYALVSTRSEVMIGLSTPVIGASSAIFGLMVAYGMVFGERIVYFMFFFPMKSKYFVAILGAIEVVLILNNGLVQGKVANLAHVCGLVSGYVFLKVWPYFGGGRSGTTKKPKSRKLKLVVNNEEFTENEKPKYWN